MTEQSETQAKVDSEVARHIRIFSREERVSPEQIAARMVDHILDLLYMEKQEGATLQQLITRSYPGKNFGKTMMVVRAIVRLEKTRNVRGVCNLMGNTMQRILEGKLQVVVEETASNEQQGGPA